MRTLWQHDEFFLLHGYESSDQLQVKSLVRWKCKTTKVFSLIVSGILFLPLFVLSFFVFCMIAIKYAIAAIMLLALELTYFKYFTTGDTSIKDK
jgi:hypothetical protein